MRREGLRLPREGLRLPREGLRLPREGLRFRDMLRDRFTRLLLLLLRCRVRMYPFSTA